ncbi:hypothetical protein Tco_0330723, partial [Tanacetum coccineum]
MALLLAEERCLKIKQTMKEEQNRQGVMQELMSKLLEDVRNISEEPKAITPDEPSKEPEDPLIMREEELSTIPDKDKSSVEDLVPILSEYKGISDDTCDVPVCDDSSTFDALSDHSEILSDSNDDGTSSDDDDFEDIEY